MVEIKSGALLGAHGRYQGMVIFQKGKKTYGRALPSYDGNADSPSRKVQNARLAAAVTHYQTIKETFLYHAWRMEATRREVISGYNLFLKENIKAYNTDYTVGDFRLLTLVPGALQVPFRMQQQEAPAGVLSITWEASPWVSRQRNKDTFMLAVIYDDEPFRVEIIENTGITRLDGTATIPLAKAGAGKAYVYAFFTNEARDAFTNHVYFNGKLE